MANVQLGWVPLNFELKDTGRNIQALGENYTMLGQILLTSAARVDLKRPDVRRDADLFLGFAHLLEILVSSDIERVATARDLVKRDAHYFLERVAKVNPVLNSPCPLYGFLVNNAGEGGLGYGELGRRVSVSSVELRKVLPQIRPENAAVRGGQILLKYLRSEE